MSYQPRTMLDSGAFSAWYHKTSIDIDSYIAFVKKHGSSFCSIVALDQIPGERAVMAKTQAQIEEAAKQSHRNFVYMQKKGIDCIPVFHQGEDFKWLEKMLDERIPYIGISPYMKAKQESIMAWMDKCFTRLTDARGRPLCKTHGFGVTGHAIVRRYPWYSVDSTSWALSAGYGNILMPSAGPQGWDFTHPIQFNISDRDTAGNNSMLHAGPNIRKMAEKYFDELALSFSDIRNFQSSRLVINAAYYMGLEKQMAVKASFGLVPFVDRNRHRPARLYKDRAVDFDYSPRIFLATMIKIAQQGKVLTQMRAQHRLISYYDCRKYEPDKIDEYTTNGYVDKAQFLYARGTKRGDLRRRMLFLKRLQAAAPEDDK